MFFLKGASEGPGSPWAARSEYDFGGRNRLTRVRLKNGKRQRKGDNYQD